LKISFSFGADGVAARIQPTIRGRVRSLGVAVDGLIHPDDAARLIRWITFARNVLG